MDLAGLPRNLIISEMTGVTIEQVIEVLPVQLYNK